jgi:hypothetical protein
MSNMRPLRLSHARRKEGVCRTSLMHVRFVPAYNTEIADGGRPTHARIRTAPRRVEKETHRSAKGIKSDQVYLANLALWLQQFPSIGFNLVFHAREAIIEAPRQHDRYCTRKYATEMSKKVETIPSDTIRALVSWPWPGNLGIPRTTLNVMLRKLEITRKDL